MIIAPSLLSADFARLGEEIASVSSAEWLHFDVMDGHFVPNISFGLPVLESVRRVTSKILDVHLMIAEPRRYVRRFCEAGADIVTFHAEACTREETLGAIGDIRDCGRMAGLSLKPATPPDALEPFLEHIDLALVMTVEPGFGYQSFMRGRLPKIAELRRMITSRGLNVKIEVDGGINADTAWLCREHGADVLVAGSYIFSQKPAKRNGHISRLRGDVT